MFTLDNFSEKISEKIVERGSDYFLNGAVTYLEEDEEGQWEAEVEGSETYHLDITLKGRTVESYYCDCPYDDDDCKHLVAVLYEMRQRIKAHNSQPAPKNSKKLTLASLLDKIDLSELRGFVTEYAASDKTFRQKLELYFADKDDRIDVGQKYSELIAKIVRTHADRGHLGYSESRKVAKELDKIVEMGYQYASNDNYKDALTVAQVLLVELMDLYKESDDSAGDLGGTFFGISELMDALATSDASLELKEELLEFLAKLYPEELMALYLPLLREWGERVYDRPGYRNLATQMIAVKKDIPLAAEAIDLLAMDLKEKNPRRPAMREELDAVLRQM